MRPSVTCQKLATVLMLAFIASEVQSAPDTETPVQGAWLNERLPADALAYKRIPHPLGMFATPKGNVLDPALRSPGNLENIRSIRQGIIDNVLPLVPNLADARLRFLLGNLESPLELAVFAAPAPSVLLAMQLGLDSNADLESAIAEFATGTPPLALAAPLDAAGNGQILGLPAPAFLRFDAASGLLLIQGGPAVTAESFSTLLSSLVPGANTRMQPIEDQLDQSGQGWFLWIDAEKTLPVAQMFMPPERLAQLQATGLDKVRTAGAGWGVANGKGRLGLVLDVAPDGNRQFLPFVANQLNLTSVGKPDAIAMFSLPTAEEFARIVTVLFRTIPGDEMCRRDRGAWGDARPHRGGAGTKRAGSHKLEWWGIRSLNPVHHVPSFASDGGDSVTPRS